jgi:hypothetical protein
MIHGMQKSISFRTFTFSTLGILLTLIPLRCFGHVVNIANIAVMSHITKIAAIETATAIWEYDPSLPDNRVLGGSLDVIASVRTVAIKVPLDCSFSCIF